jgi:hypothetical protein
MEKYKVIMLPTDEATKIGLSKSSRKVYYPVQVDKNFDIGQVINILESYADIKVGDIVTGIEGTQIFGEIMIVDSLSPIGFYLKYIGDRSSTSRHIAKGF